MTAPDVAATLHLDAREGPPELLFIYLHGVGGVPLDMAAAAERIARAYPKAVHLLPEGFAPFDGGGAGRQWFSAAGVDEANRPGRIAAVLPALVAFVQAAQRHYGLPASRTALVGFSQGALMSLELAKAHPEVAGRVLAFGGRFATLPERPPPGVVLHLLHGKEDAVIPARHTVDAATTLVSLGGDVTADVVPGIGHSLHPALVERAVEHLQTFLARRVWEEALAEAPLMPPVTGKTLQ